MPLMIDYIDILSWMQDLFEEVIGLTRYTIYATCFVIIRFQTHTREQ